MRTMRRGDACGKSLGTPTAAASSVTDNGSRRTPVATAESPRATERKSGITKKRPACRRNWKKKDVSPACSLGMRSMRGSTRTGPPRRSWRLSHSTKSARTPAPPRMSQITGERPSHWGASGFGCTKPPRPGADDAEDDHAEARGREKRAHGVEPRRRGRAGSRPCACVRTRMPSTITTSPAKTQRQLAYVVQQPADQRPDGHGDGAGRRHQPVGPGPLRRPEVGRHERDDRGHDEARPRAPRGGTSRR